MIEYSDFPKTQALSCHVFLPMDLRFVVDVARNHLQRTLDRVAQCIRGAAITPSKTACTCGRSPEIEHHY